MFFTNYPIKIIKKLSIGSSQTVSYLVHPFKKKQKLFFSSNWFKRRKGYFY